MRDFPLDERAKCSVSDAGARQHFHQVTVSTSLNAGGHSSIPRLPETFDGTSSELSSRAGLRFRVRTSPHVTCRPRYAGKQRDLKR